MQLGRITLKIILHLGSHKTASTYIQSRLDAARSTLMEHGIMLALVPEIRRTIKSKLARPRLLRLTSSRPRDMLAKTIGDLVTQAADAGAERLVISEENLLGPMSRLLTNVPFYDHAERRLASLLPHLKGHDLTLAVAARNYATFYRSVWGFEIRETYRPFDEDLKGRLLQRSGEWRDLLNLLVRLFGSHVPIVFWRYEDFQTIENQVFTTLTGQDAVAVIEPSNHRPLQGPSGPAIRRLGKLSEDGPVSSEIVARVCHVKSQDKGFPPYTPWSKQERKDLGQRYRTDVETVLAMPSVVPIQPASKQE